MVGSKVNNLLNALSKMNTADVTAKFEEKATEKVAERATAKAVAKHAAKSSPTSHEMRRRYEFIVNTSSELMALISRDYVYEAVNEAYCQARAQTRSEIVGSTVWALWGDETFANTIKEPMDRCLTGKEVNYQAWYDHAALGHRYMDVVYYPYYNSQNEVSHVVVVSQDITSRERAEQSMRSYSTRLETLHKIDRAILAAQLPHEIAGAVLNQLTRLLPCDVAEILVFEHPQDMQANTLFLHNGAQGSEQSSRQNNKQIADIQSDYGAAAPLFPRETREDGALTRLLAQFPECPNSVSSGMFEESRDVEEPASSIHIPIAVQGKPLGTLSIGAHQPNAFDEQHIAIAREVAYPLALAIHQSQLKQALQHYNTELEVLVKERTLETERRREAAEGLRDILAILNSNRPLNEILDFIVAQAKRLLGVDVAAIFSVETQDNDTNLNTNYTIVNGDRVAPFPMGLTADSPFLSSTFGQTQDDKEHRNITPTADDNTRRERSHEGVQLVLQSIASVSNLGFSAHDLAASQAVVRQAIAQRAPLLIGNMHNEQVALHALSGDEQASFQDIRLRCRYCALLAVPLVISQKVYGSIVIYYAQPHIFTQEETKLAASFADQIALAVENATLHQQAERAGMMEERGRLARELHDSVTQSLYSLTLFAEAGLRVAGAGQMERTHSYLTQLGSTAQQALKEMRLLLYEIRPLVLEQEGLIGALRRRLDAVEKRAGVQVDLYVEEPFILPTEVEEGLYRICQEALNNSLKHAHHSRIEIRAYREGNWVNLEVKDNGRGFDTAAIDSGGMGLLNMKARAARFQGQLSIHTSEQGTLVSVRLDVRSTKR